jgi:hypothetical protein
MGWLEMLGIAGFQRNLSLSYAHLQQGIQFDLWSCHEAISFHPDCPNVSESVGRAAELGGVWSMIRKGLTTPNTSDAVSLFRNLGTALTSNWWKRRRSGMDFGDAVALILNLTEDGDLMQGWKTIEDLAHHGHLPAALWMAEGLQTGEIGRKNESEAVEILKPHIVWSPWVVDVVSAIESDEPFDRMGLFRVAGLLGYPFSDHFMSYPALFE